MKKSFIAIVAAAAMAAAPAAAQTTMKYQVLVCNDEGKAMTDAELGFQVKIHEGAADGTTVFSEAYTSTTSPMGIAYLNVGSQSAGTSLDALDWGGTTYFIEVSVDRGSGYVSLGSTQIMNVPCAIHADRAAEVVLTSPSGKKFKVTINDKGELTAVPVAE